MNDNPFQIPPPPPGTPTVAAKPAVVEPQPVLGIPAAPVSPTVTGDSATHRLTGLPRRLPSAPPAAPTAPPGAPPAAHAPTAQPPTAPPAAGPVARTWQLTFADGQRATLSGVLLVGRNPATREPWPDAQTIAVVDAQKTVSKTHAAFELTADGVRVHDLDSTNGVLVRSAHGEKVIAPRHPQLVQERAEVSLGEFVVQVTVT